MDGVQLEQTIVTVSARRLEAAECGKVLGVGNRGSSLTPKCPLSSPCDGPKVRDWAVEWCRLRALVLGTACSNVGGSGGVPHLWPCCCFVFFACLDLNPPAAIRGGNSYLVKAEDPVLMCKIDTCGRNVGGKTFLGGWLGDSQSPLDPLSLFGYHQGRRQLFQTGPGRLVSNT